MDLQSPHVQKRKKIIKSPRANPKLAVSFCSRCFLFSLSLSELKAVSTAKGRGGITTLKMQLPLPPRRHAGSLHKARLHPVWHIQTKPRTADRCYFNKILPFFFLSSSPHLLKAFLHHWCQL